MLGSGVAQFAGQAGLEQQKSDLANQTAVLADQLATTRESAGRTQAGEIAATAAEKAQEFEAGQGALQRSSAQAIAATGASATLGAAGIQAAAERYRADVASKDVYATIASAEPEQQARILAQTQATALAAVQVQNAKDLTAAHTALQTETGKPDADPNKIAALKAQVTTLETSAGTEAAVTTAAAAMYRTDMDSVQHYNQQLVAATAALNAPEMSDTDKTAAKGLVTNLKLQLTGAQRALQYSSDLVHGRVATQTGNTPPTVNTGDRPPLASFGVGQALPNPNAGPRAVPPAVLPGLLNNGASP
jgi:hypothetical protein